MKKKFMCLMMAMVMVLTLAACGGSKTAETPAESTGSSSEETAAPSGAAFKLGGTGPLTGGAAIYGNAAKNGAQIAVDEINAMGGIQFELKYEDDQHDAEKAVNAYNALKDWGMQISLGSVTSKPCEATSAETYADRIFALTPSASATAVTEGKDNMFQTCFMDPNQGSASAQYISEKGLGSKIAIIWKNDDVYSKGIHDTFTAKAAGQLLVPYLFLPLQPGQDNPVAAIDHPAHDTFVIRFADGAQDTLTAVPTPTDGTIQRLTLVRQSPTGAITTLSVID